MDNNCTINIETRRNCNKCRLEKCFDIGMRPVAKPTNKIAKSETEICQFFDDRQEAVKNCRIQRVPGLDKKQTLDQ